jgi:8-oxo-dGTP pyrophosphatase MutT (NUDIX family)
VADEVSIEPRDGGVGWRFRVVERSGTSTGGFTGDAGRVDLHATVRPAFSEYRQQFTITPPNGAARPADVRFSPLRVVGFRSGQVVRFMAAGCPLRWLGAVSDVVIGVGQMTASEPVVPAVSGVLPVGEYVAGLPRKRMATGVLFRDGAGRVLLVQPSYKPNWEIPGGAVEAGESPWAAGTRELSEELGWDRLLGRLLVVDHVRPQDSRPEGVVFVFDGGELDESDLEGVVFPDAEILSAGFYSLSDAGKRVKPLLADRLAAALEAVRQGTTVLCEQGRRIS